MSALAQLRRASGLDLTAAELARAVARRMAARGIARADDYLLQLAPEEIDALLELLVIPESWMFRDADAFRAATAFVRAQLAAVPGRSLRILSVPCASGEEPYSMAMALQDAGVPAGACLIEAVDLSHQAIERARRGCYTRNAFRGHELGFRDRYFTPEGDHYRIAPQLRAQVRFSQGNLLDFDSAANAGRYDLIFCRNLLIYFDDVARETAVHNIHEMLYPGGYICLGHTESMSRITETFEPVRYPDAIVYRETRDK